jgi:site-specific DNA-cytosine methylase
MSAPLMLDLFSGLGGASDAFAAAGWAVVRIDNDPALTARRKVFPNAVDVVADLSTWSWNGPRPTLIWASPPCTEFSRESMPWCRTGNPPSMDLVNAGLRIIRECDPKYWVLENVRGATKWFEPTLGKRRSSHGPFFLWGTYPRFEARVEPFKEKLSSKRRAERAKVPECVSVGLLRAVEADLGVATPHSSYPMQGSR